MSASLAVGLSDAEVAQRVADGKTNDVPTRAARSVSEIVRANVFTRINAILGVLLIIVLSTGSVINGAFGLLIVANSAIGIIQELRAKQTLDKLAIVGQAKPLVRRQSGHRAIGAQRRRARRRDRARPRRPDRGRRRDPRGGQPRDRRIAADRRGRPDRQRRRRPGDVGQFRRRGQRRLPGHQGRPGGLRRQAGRGGQQVHAGEIRAAQRHQQDPAVHHLPAGAGGRADHLHPAVHHRLRLARIRAAHGRGAGARWCPRVWC